MTALVRPTVISHHLTLIHCDQPPVLLQLNLLLCPGPENLIEVFSVFIGLGRLLFVIDWVVRPSSHFSDFRQKSHTRCAKLTNDERALAIESPYCIPPSLKKNG
jgi:hypothetical protein